MQKEPNTLHSFQHFLLLLLNNVLLLPPIALTLNVAKIEKMFIAEESALSNYEIKMLSEQITNVSIIFCAFSLVTFVLQFYPFLIFILILWQFSFLVFLSSYFRLEHKFYHDE